MENDLANKSMSSIINSTFAACNSIYTNSTLSTEEFSALFLPDDKLRPGILPVKHLALQLHRMEVFRSKLKAKGVQRSHDSLAGKIEAQKSRIKELTDQCDQRKLSIAQMRSDILTLYDQSVSQLDSQISQLQSENVSRISRLAYHLHYNHYKVFRDVAFPNFIHWKSSSRSRRVPSLQLYGNPIIPLSCFLSHNNKLIAINTFLENLIQLQSLLVDLFSSQDTIIDLPHLTYLQRMIPDSRFYNAVQNRIDGFLDEEKTGSEKESTTEMQSTEDNTTAPENEGLDKVVVKDNVIKVPISFKTVNFQRRASTRQASEGALLPPESADSERPSSMQTPSRESNNEVSKVPKTSKKVVIMAHKILTKPFTKLTLKEYLKFIIIVVKIIVNFQVFFTITAKHPSRASHNPDLRNSRYRQSSEADLNVNLFDFESMLSKIAQMDWFFLSDRGNANTISRMESSISLRTESGGSELSSGPDFSGSELVSSSKISRVRALYHSIFAGKRPREQRPMSSPGVYGMMSEGTSVDSSSADESRPAGNDDTVAQNEMRDMDVKEIMEKVHQLIVNGNDKDPNNEAIKLATHTMMEESKAQLDEWDVVSRLY